VARNVNGVSGLVEETLQHMIRFGVLHLNARLCPAWACEERRQLQTGEKPIRLQTSVLKGRGLPEEIQQGGLSAPAQLTHHCDHLNIPFAHFSLRLRRVTAAHSRISTDPSTRLIRRAFDFRSNASCVHREAQARGVLRMNRSVFRTLTSMQQFGRVPTRSNRRFLERL
jgi:hypothetical protein